MNFTNKNILIVGSGISGMGALQALSTVHAHCIIFDGNAKLTEEDVVKKFPEGCSAQVCIGTVPEQVLSCLDMAVVSPGVPIDNPLLNVLREHNVPIIGEIELGYQLAKGRIIAITGTNGKTTTTTLVGQMMKDYYESVFVVGNIGYPYTLEALKTTEESITVAEISSFQLETVEEFCPEVSAILNDPKTPLPANSNLQPYWMVLKNKVKKIFHLK